MMLSSYLDAIGDKRFQLGGALDCATFMADWLIACGAPDAMADLRGRYSSIEEGAGEDLTFEAACVRRFEAIGLIEVGEPAAGRVALAHVRYVGGVGCVGAICLDAARAAVLTTQGLAITRLPLKRIWRWPRP